MSLQSTSFPSSPNSQTKPKCILYDDKNLLTQNVFYTVQHNMPILCSNKSSLRKSNTFWGKTYISFQTSIKCWRSRGSWKKLRVNALGS